MRNIKFRVWDKEQKVMLSWEQLMDVKYNERWFIDNTGKNYINCIFKDTSYIFEQYTGLNDKFGKEIYEGDILNQYPGFACTWKKRVCSVEYGDASFWMKVGNSSFIFSDRECTFDVIGNIHQNLLGDKE